MLDASLVHVLVDIHFGLYGETSSWVSSLQAVNPSLTSSNYAGWIYAAAVASSGESPRSCAPGEEGVQERGATEVMPLFAEVFR